MTTERTPEPTRIVPEAALWPGRRDPLALQSLWFVRKSVYEAELEPRTNFGSWVGVHLDRLKVARAYRSLRWTHAVRQVALRRWAGPACGWPVST